MNKLYKILLLIGFSLFLIIHYAVFDISKEHFPVFAYFYPFIAKVWFEIGRLLLLLNTSINLSALFYILKYFILGTLAITLFAFKYQRFYIFSLCLGVFISAIYLIILVILGLITVYPIYSLLIISTFFIFSVTLVIQIKKNKFNYIKHSFNSNIKQQ